MPESVDVGKSASADLDVTVGQYTHRGPKDINQDFHGALVPSGHQLASRGVAVALADGISSSNVSQVASQAAVTGFLQDYYCTSDAWSVRKSAQRVILATNSWLYAQTRQSQFRFDHDRGYVCTLSVMVLKSATAHLFHVGDARIYRVQGHSLEQLTTDHRVWVSRHESYLGRALGVGQRLEIDYQTLPLEAGDVFVMATDGVHGFLSQQQITAAISAHGDDLDKAAQAIVSQALDQGSDDNLTVQVVRVNRVSDKTGASELYRQMNGLPFPPELDARMDFDGYRIIRKLHASNRSHVFLAVDRVTEGPVVLKTPAVELREDPVLLERFLMEEWIARRIDNPHVVRPCPPERRRNYLYIALEYIEGQTLEQWMRDHPKPELTVVRDIIGQLARGVRGFHRLEMLHQDLKPGNVMIDTMGTVRIVDFGAARVAGLMDLSLPEEGQGVPGAALHTAPEYLLGHEPTARSDQFSLALLTYQMLSGKLPYGVRVPRIRHPRDLNALTYHSLRMDRPDVPVWMDEAIRKALHPDPARRYEALSEFLQDLSRPSRNFLNRTRKPFMERDPVAFWQGGCALLLLALLASFLGW
nr:bifunctional protein-serine/threonine kinase/phosphatase [Marinobacter daqiaonensis]